MKVDWVGFWSGIPFLFLDHSESQGAWPVEAKC